MSQRPGLGGHRSADDPDAPPEAASGFAAAGRSAGAAGGEDMAELVHTTRLATLGMLVAGIAHELNTPLGALASNHDVLRRALQRLSVILEDERVDEHELEEVRRVVRALNDIMRVNDLAVERVVHIVGSLRSFGRPDRAEIDRVDLHTGIDSSLALLRHELKDRITVAREYGELPPVECYPNELNQVFMNLMLNACQAMDGPGTLTIRTRPREGGVAVEVSDTGCGIPDENLRRIFQPGFTTKGSRMGMGLGLLITSQIVDRHGGRIDVRSRVGEGTTFTVTLPERLPAAAAAAPTADDPA